MPRICMMTGRRTTTGHKVSHSQHKSKRTFCPNIHKRSLLNPATGKMMTLKLSTSAVRTLAKWDREGKSYDLRKLTT